MLITLLMSAALAVPAPGTVVIDFQDNIKAADIQQLIDGGLRLEGVELVAPSSEDEALYTGRSSDVTATINQLNQLGIVEVAEPLMVYMPTGFVTVLEACGPSGPDPIPAGPNDPAYDKQWHMRSMDSEWVWANTKSGAGVVVAVLDTGLTITKDVDPARVVDRVNFTESPGPEDRHGHGTHCAGTVAQWTNNGYGTAGLAKDASILSVKVLSDEGYGYNHWIAAGIDYASDHAKVISMSLGGSQSSGTINAAIDRAIAKGVVVVAASGNDGRGKLGFPAGYDPVIAIGSYGPDDVRAPYSNWGKGLDLMAPGGNKNIKGGGVFQVTEYAGKEDVYEWQGTSMATPHAAAAAAILLGEGVPADKVEALMVETAKAAPQGQPSGEYGKGLIDIKSALKKFKGEGVEAAAAPPGRFDLPWPSPAGNLTYLVLALSLGALFLVKKTYRFSNKFMLTAAAFAVISGGPLYALSLLNLNLPGLAMFMVPWLEIPEFIFGAGASGFPLWMSPLPLCIPFLVGTPLGARFRAITLGLLSTWASYLLVNSFVGFNELWWITSFGTSAWLGVSTLMLLSMGGVITEFHYKHQQGGE